MDVEAVRNALGTLPGLKVDRFTEEDLRKLWNAGYRTPEDLELATREGLREATLVSALVDRIIRAQGMEPSIGVWLRDASPVSRLSIYVLASLLGFTSIHIRSSVGRIAYGREPSQDLGF